MSQGIVKVNVGTILNVAFTGAVRAHLEGDPRVVDPRKYLTPARDAVAAVASRIIAALEPPAS